MSLVVHDRMCQALVVEFDGFGVDVDWDSLATTPGVTGQGLSVRLYPIGLGVRLRRVGLGDRKVGTDQRGGETIPEVGGGDVGTHVPPFRIPITGRVEDEGATTRTEPSKPHS